jgi:hypothetical protein
VALFPSKGSTRARRRGGVALTAFALISGTISRAPEVKTSKAGKPYTSATIKIAAGDSAEFWSIMAFNEAVQAELARLREGDTISAQGAMKVELYTPRDGGASKISRTIFADLVLTLKRPALARRAAADGARDYDSYGGR